MKQFTINPQNSETASNHIRARLAELGNQCWNRNKSQVLAQGEGIDLNDEQWAVIVFLRKYYLMHGLPTHARVIAQALNKRFASLGGNKFLHQLFSGGPVTQGSRFGNLRTPAYATDTSFGTCY